MNMSDDKVKVPNPVGRPSMYTPELVAELCRRIASSPDGLRTICAADDMPAEKTVYVWLFEHEEFVQQYMRARQAQGEIFAQDTISIADSVGLTREQIDKARLRISTRQWAAGKLRPKVYGDSTTLRGDKENPIDMGLAVLLEAAGEKRKQLPAIDVEFTPAIPVDDVNNLRNVDK